MQTEFGHRGTSRWPSASALVAWIVGGLTILIAIGVGTYALLRSPAASTSAGRDAVANAPTNQSPAPAAQPLTLFAVGDIMLDRNVRAMMEKNGEDYPFVEVDTMTRGRDLVFANLEGPIVERYVATPTGSLRFSFPTSTGALLHRHGFNLLSVANNHSFDYGQAGVSLEQSVLAEAGILAAGNARTIAAEHVVTTSVRGRTVVLLAFSSAVNPSFDAAAALALVRQFAMDERAAVIVSIHWGNEYQTVSNRAQRQFAHQVIDAGADLILGHHPHVVQELEAYDDRLIAYSLGNFIFDQYFSKETQEGLALDCRIADDFRCDLLPLVSVRSQPRPMAGPARVGFLEALAARSDPALAAAIRDGTVVVPATTAAVEETS